MPVKTPFQDVGQAVPVAAGRCVQHMCHIGCMQHMFYIGCVQHISYIGCM